MGRVHWVGGEKGGVGTSVVARLLAQYWIDRKKRWLAFDTDRSHGALLRYYAEFSRPLDTRSPEGLDQVVEALDYATEEIVVDLAGQTEHDVEAWLASGEVLDLVSELGHEFYFWYVIDSGKDSIELLRSFLDELDPAAQIVCVQNRGRGDDFSLFAESKLRNRIQQRGGLVAELPALPGDAMARIDAYDKSFWAAVNNMDPSGGTCLTRMQRRRAHVFLRSAYALIEQVLAPPDDSLTRPAPREQAISSPA